MVSNEGDHRCGPALRSACVAGHRAAISHLTREQRLGLRGRSFPMSALCRDCLADIADEGTHCPLCEGTRVLAHPELDTLAIAHLDCDAFYAAVEERDDPNLKGKPLIVGGGKRGVVMTANYAARKFGAKSAKPMFQALKLCPQAIIVKPDMGKYARVARDIRALLLTATPQVEPLSLDEAYLDLSGTARLHAMAPAKTMTRLGRRSEH